MMNGAHKMLHALKMNGVDVVFGYPGGAIMPFYDALYDGDIKHVLCRHEQGAIMAAIGYARVTGKVGVCLATSGPGATNLITGLADAQGDSVPLIAITGQVGVPAIGTDAFQEIDVIGLSLACTKHSFLIDDVKDLSKIVSEAFEIASEGRPGPVLIDFPKNVQLAVTDESTTKRASIGLKKKNHETKIDDDQLHQAQSLIENSKKPILYVGGGVVISGAVDMLRDYMKKTGIPAVSTLKALGSVDPDNDLYLGMLGMHGTKEANYAVQQSDLLIVLGARFDDRVTGKLDAFAPHAKIIQIDVDPAEINKRRHVDVALKGDIKEYLPKLEEKLNIHSWQEHVKEMKKRFSQEDESDSDVISPVSFLKEFSKALPKKFIVTTDVGQHQMWAAQHIDFYHPESLVTSGAMGTMGFGLPAAIGAQIGCPHELVVCVTGDGSFMMNIQELGTIAQEKLPVKILLLDNSRLGMVRQWQQLFYKERYSETILDDNPDFLMIAKAFGIKGIYLDKKEDIESSVKAFLEEKGPCLLQVKIAKEDNVWPLVPPGSPNEKMMEGIDL